MQVPSRTQSPPVAPVAAAVKAQAPPPPALDMADGHATADAFAEQLKNLREMAAGRTFPPHSTPIKVQMEVKANASVIQRHLAPLRWSVSSLSGNNHNTGGDCSHSEDGGGAAFIRVQSPFMTVRDGAFHQMADVVDRLNASGANTGSTGALRYSVQQLPETTMRNLVGVHLGHEDILYRLSRGGGAGRSLGHKKSYAVPLSRLGITPTTRLDRLTPVLNLRHASVNTYTQGQVELRYFDSTLKAPVMQANAALVLGVLSAASDGRLQESGNHRVGMFNFFVAANRWQNFIRETVGEGPLATQLENQFRDANGHLW